MTEPVVLTGPMRHGAARLVAGTTSVLGYAYTEPRTDAPGQLQRWLLYADPENDFGVEASPEMSDVTLEEWLKRAGTPRSEGGLWEDRAYYIEAAVDLYRYGEQRDGQSWRSIPYPLPDPPKFPGKSTQLTGEQIDVGGGKVLQRLATALIEGHVYSTNTVDDPVSVEYWYLPAGFTPGGTSEILTSITPETGLAQAKMTLSIRSALRARWSLPAAALQLAQKIRHEMNEAAKGLGLLNDPSSLKDFVDQTNAAWREGDAFAIARCYNSREKPPLPGK